jgi:tRNA nucleotidyltransferase/poly(A) polymerase
LKAKQIINPNNLQREMFSRDFTCNALLMSLDLKNISDPTRQGFKDIKEKMVRTCLDPKITLTSNRNRVVRAIYLACKLDFDIDPSIIEFVKKYPQTIKISTDKVMAEKLNEAFKKNADKASKLITQMGLWNYIPITEFIYQYYQKHLKANPNG